MGNATGKHEVEYKMNRRRRGLALIFNQWDFNPEMNLSERRGSFADHCKLGDSLAHLGFEVKAFTDLNKSEVTAELDKAAKTDHSDADCILIAFMSHGDGYHVCAKDDKLAIKEFTDKFDGTNCRSLVGKPKIFIWQACRGAKHDEPVMACDATNIEINYEVLEAAAVYTLPAAADFIMCYSVAEGYCSYRDLTLGSWYIQDLCEALNMYGDSLEFTQLLTLVNAKVSERSGMLKLKGGERIQIKQISCFASMLTRKLYFRPKK